MELITMRLPQPIIQFFKREAAKPGSAGYQTLIRQVLENYIANVTVSGTVEERLDKLEAKLKGK